MKMKNLLLAFAGLALLSIQSNAQYVGPSALPAPAVYEDANSDYVTIGSRLPYYVAPDATIKTMVDNSKMDPSNFLWEFLASDLTTSLGLTPRVFDGSTTLTAGEAAGWVTENEISITWSGGSIAAGTQYVVRATERSNPLGAGNIDFGCIGAPVVRNIFVLARPTVSFTAANNGAGCSVSTGSTFYVPLSVTGLGSWEVKYSVSYNGAAAVAQTPYTLTVADPIGSINDGNVIAQSTVARPAAGTPTGSTDGLAVVIPADGYGYYDVTIQGISDRISRKSLDVLADGGFTGAITTYRIYVTPTPTTQPIQHIRNL